MTLSEIRPDYDGDWRNLEGYNIHETHANSRYYIVKDANVYIGKNKDGQYKDGNILVAAWSTADRPSLDLFYDTMGTTVDGLECSGETLKRADVYLGLDKWGTALDCETGPEPSGGASSPPAIILTESETGDVYVVVEESSSYPSFLYSVWKAPGGAVEMEYSFHLASTVRLAEAVVTGIVNGETDGGGCFAMLRLFSETREPYEETLQRASPFGEHPTGDTVQLQDLETIGAGVKINMNALLCLVWVLALTAVGIAWSICLKSSIGLDVYDRDELLRAVSLQGKASQDPTKKHGGIRIFVRRQDAGNIMVFINDAGAVGSADQGGRGWRQGGWRQFFPCSGPNVVAGNGVHAPGDADDIEADLLNDGFGGAIVPADGTVSLGNTWSDTVPGMCASPVHSSVPSVAPTPVRTPRGGRRSRSPAAASASVAATPVGSARVQALFDSP